MTTSKRSPDVASPVRVGIALGGGAVRGAAHIGVLAALDDAGLAPSVITGTSAGAIVGGLYIMNVGLDEVFNPKLRRT